MKKSPKKRINDLEDRNLELAKEILLNESAIYYVENEIRKLENEVIDHQHFLNRLEDIRGIIEVMKKKNELYRTEIIQNDLKIKSLKNE